MRQTFIAALLLLTLASGCTETKGPFDGLTRPQAQALARELKLTHERELDDDLRSAFLVRQPRNVLVLSGGGSVGAFGAGVLNGWRHTPGGRPTFDVVTGISTGALMATFAFLGEERDDRALAAVYTTTSNSDIFRVFASGSFDSLLDTQPLEKLIGRCVTADVIRRVAAAHARGRRLYVATVDLDANQMVIWPMSKLAAEGTPASIARFRRILLASASVPVVFPPVRIDGDLHVDGGLREVVFLRSAMLGFPSALSDCSQSSHDEKPPTVYVILNSTLQSAPQAVKDDVISIGMRSLALYQDSQQLADLREIAHLAESHKPAFQFRFIAVPDVPEAEDADGVLSVLFDRDRMRFLYRLGEGFGRAESSWSDAP